jgi:hypothetical protein
MPFCYASTRSPKREQKFSQISRNKKGEKGGKKGVQPGNPFEDAVFEPQFETV